jgi:hypothetical protein
LYGYGDSLLIKVISLEGEKVNSSRTNRQRSTSIPLWHPTTVRAVQSQNPKPGHGRLVPALAQLLIEMATIDKQIVWRMEDGQRCLSSSR